jgi:hypothetical protein
MNKQLIFGLVCTAVAAVLIAFSLNDGNVVTPKAPSTTQNTSNQAQPQGQAPVSHAQMDEALSIAEKYGLPVKKAHISHDSHEKATVDFGKYLSQKQKEEIWQATNKDSTGLDVEIDPVDGREVVNLKGRFDHVNVSVIDENGTVHSGEWAPSKDPSVNSQ